jgi:hypothetical protein
MREGCIGKQNSRIGKWKFENGKWQEVRGEAISEQIAAIRKQETRTRIGQCPLKNIR